MDDDELKRKPKKEFILTMILGGIGIPLILISVGLFVSFVVDTPEEEYDEDFIDGVHQTRLYIDTYLYADDDTLVIDCWRGIYFWNELVVYVGDRIFSTENNRTFSGDMVVFTPDIEIDILEGVEYFISIHKESNNKRVWDRKVIALEGDGRPLARDLPG